MIKVAILYICTGRYAQFFDGFYKSAEQYLLQGVEKRYFVFTDQEQLTNAANVELLIRPCKGFPEDSLFRFDRFLEIEIKLVEVSLEFGNFVVGGVFQTFDEPVPESSYLIHVLFHVVASFLECDCHGSDARYVYGSGALASFLGSAFDNVHELYAVACIEYSDALRTVEFMTRHRKHVYIHCLYIYRQMSCSLYGIRVEQHLLCLAECTDLRYRLYSAHLVICKHNAYKRCIVSDGIFYILDINNAV